MIFTACNSLHRFSFFGDTAPFDDWEGEAFADISELLNPLPDVPAAAAIGHQTIGASAQDQIPPAPPLEEPLGIQDFDLDLLDGRSSSPKPDLVSFSDLLLDPLEAGSSNSSNSALRNDVMLTTGQQANVTGGHRHNHYHLLGPGFLPKEEGLHTHNRCGSESMPPSLDLVYPMLGIRIRMFLGFWDPDPLVRGTDPDPSLF
jgi:hypothetical protein